MLGINCFKNLYWTAVHVTVVLSDIFEVFIFVLQSVRMMIFGSRGLLLLYYLEWPPENVNTVSWCQSGIHLFACSEQKVNIVKRVGWHYILPFLWHVLEEMFRLKGISLTYLFDPSRKLASTPFCTCECKVSACNEWVCAIWQWYIIQTWEVLLSHEWDMGGQIRGSLEWAQTCLSPHLMGAS